MSIFTKALRPTGNRILIKSKVFDKRIFSPYNTYFYQSGTAALAAAILACKNHSNLSYPEVILPAYCCPDIISAITHSGAIPVLVDLEKDSPRMSSDEIEKNITKSTIAIIAINFLGIPENMSSLQSICDSHKITLIEDSAQGFPNKDLDSYWNGDFIILSFGRGKPLNLLGGGVVLTKSNNEIERYLPVKQARNSSLLTKLKYTFKIMLYNTIIKPFFYGIVSKIPGLKIGETVFKNLENISAINKYTLAILETNLIAFQKEDRSGAMINKHLNSVNNKFIINLPEIDQNENNMLRYPILIVDKTLREQVVSKFKDKGISEMYKKTLPFIDGVTNHLKNNVSFPNAENFANQLITIPIHNNFTENDIIEITDYISNYKAS